MLPNARRDATLVTGTMTGSNRIIIVTPGVSTPPPPPPRHRPPPHHPLSTSTSTFDLSVISPAPFVSAMASSTTPSHTPPHCQTCYTELPSQARPYLTPCCSTPICERCLSRNPRLREYDPCLRCGDVRTAEGSGRVARGRAEATRWVGDVFLTSSKLSLLLVMGGVSLIGSTSPADRIGTRDRVAADVHPANVH